MVYKPVGVEAVAEQLGGWIGNTPTPDPDNTPSPKYCADPPRPLKPDNG